MAATAPPSTPDSLLSETFERIDSWWVSGAEQPPAALEEDVDRAVLDGDLPRLRDALAVYEQAARDNCARAARWVAAALVFLSFALASPAPLHAEPPTGDMCLKRGGELNDDVSLKCPQDKCPPTRTGTSTDTPTRTGTITNTPTRTRTTTATPTHTATPASTATATDTPTVSQTPTVTATPTDSGDSEQGQLFLGGVSAIDTTTIFGGATNYEAGMTTENNTSFPLPFAIRARAMYVGCTTAPGSGKTLTIQLRKNSADITGATCAMANTTACNVTLTNDATADFAIGDRISLTLIQGVTAATASQCRVTVYYRTSGDTAEADSIDGGGGGQYNAGATSVDYCGHYQATAGGTVFWQCQNTTQNRGRWIYTGGTLTGLAARTDTFRAAAPGTFLLMTGDGANSTDLTGQLVGGTLNFQDSACTSNCTLGAGELVHLRSTQDAGNSSIANYRRYAWSVNGVGQQFHGSMDDTANTARYTGPLRSESAGTIDTVAVRIAKDSVARNLHAKTVTHANALTVTLYCGSTVAGMAATALTCTTNTGAGAFCDDTTHAVTLTAGDWCAYRTLAATSGTGGAYVAIVSALGAAAAPANTPTFTATPTATATATATVTATPTPLSGTFDAVCITGDCATIGKIASVYPPTGTAMVTANFLNANRSLVGSTFFHEQIGVCWDTSALPDTATVVSCVLRIETSTEAILDDDNRSLTMAWRAADGSWTAADYDITAGVDAHAGTDLGSITSNTVTDFTLINCGNVDPLGDTCLKGWVSGGQPPGDNLVNFSTSAPAPQLRITYQP